MSIPGDKSYLGVFIRAPGIESIDSDAALAEWLQRYGDAVVDEGVRRSELEMLVEATERLDIL